MMFPKKIYGSKIAPACSYCTYGALAADGKMIYCRKRGVVSPYYSCRKFHYDPLMRVPRRQELPKFDPSDFSLD
ncbi:hypothetical protein [uncultured Gemmiger sp.]|uniref:hypothetical protein n=1 Tax=uncultured Gemmiger sp. TaxID=1623490 RepID=UPI0025F987AB|nr:hypothetical protein [uncultured Gemmiger sp.]